MRLLVSAALVIVGIIHRLPLTGMAVQDRLASLYGVHINDHNLLILMRHRAVLFGLLGAYMVTAAALPALQVSAFLAGFVSVVSFLFLAWSVGPYNPAIARVVAVDVAALLILIVGSVAYLLRNRV